MHETAAILKKGYGTRFSLFAPYRVILVSFYFMQQDWRHLGANI